MYRHSVPNPAALAKTLIASAADPLLAKFLQQYSADDCFLDWGDDPGFFAASELLRDVNAASWGVCRRDVRTQLTPGDIVVWFCAKQDMKDLGVWRYYFVGCATIKHVISRQELWQEQAYAPYRQFYNVLAKQGDSALVQHETFYDYHSDWQRRASAGYAIFDESPRLTRINVQNPVLVAEKLSDSPLEHWLSGDSPRVRDIERVLFRDLGHGRNLRTLHRQRPHRHIALHRAPRFRNAPVEPGLLQLRETLLALA